MGLLLYFLDAPELVAVSDKMPEFMGGVKSGSRPVVFVRAEDYDRPVREGQREGIHIGGVKGQANYQNSLFLECPHDILDRAAWQTERLPCLPSYVLELCSGRSEFGDRHPRQRHGGETGCLSKDDEIMGDVRYRSSSASVAYRCATQRPEEALMGLRHGQAEESARHLEDARHAMESLCPGAGGSRFKLADGRRCHVDVTSQVCLTPLLQLARKA
jgi:hypothetical protein